MNKLICLLLPVVLFLIVFLNGCENSSGPSSTVSIPADLLPLDVGRSWTFDAMEVDTSGNVIPNRIGTDIMTVKAYINFNGLNCYMLIDSLIIGSEINTDIDYFHIDSGGDVWQYIDLGVNSQDSAVIGWRKILNRTIGIGQQHVVFDTTVQMQGMSTRFTITSVLKNADTITVPFGRFNNAYPFEMTYRIEIQFGQGTFTYSQTNYTWIVPGIGFVKFKEPLTQSQNQATGGYLIKELRAKNF